MIESLTRTPLARLAKRLAAPVWERLISLARSPDRGEVILKLSLAAYVGGLLLLFAGTVLDYRDAGSRDLGEEAATRVGALPSLVPIVSQGLALFIAILALLVSLWIRVGDSLSRRRALVVGCLALASFAGLVAWMPTDVIETHAAMLGRAPAGETPSIPAYFGKLFLVSMLILSVPFVALAYFRLGLMDRYMVHNFLTPFSMCLFSFMAIWAIADFTDNGDTLAGLPFGTLLGFYVAQVPFVVLFVLPIAVLLSVLHALSKMSKSNEFISMICAGRSVVRILLPIFVAGTYVSLVGLAFKYEWAPDSVGYKEAIIQTAKRERYAKRHGVSAGWRNQEIWSKRGWMHVNEVESRTWFVGRVPLELSDEMGDVVVFQLDGQDQTTKMWVAKRAKWVWDASPPKWILHGVRIYTYGEDRVPQIENRGRLELTEWSETPWKVLSSSQNPEYLGIPGLTMYLNANRDQDDRSLATFRTNWWYVFAEPAVSFAMILVAAPLGIVYSRRGVMGGVTAAIIIFAMMYVMRGTFLAMGHSNRMSPFLAAWLTNFIVAGIGLVLLWFRAQNRDIPNLKTLLKGLVGRLPKKRAAA